MENTQPSTDLIRSVSNTADADALLRMMEIFCRHFNYSFDQTLRQNLIRQLLENPSQGSLWLIQHNNQPVGYVALTYGFAFEFGGKTALVDELFIEEKYRGEGRGRRVLLGIQQLASQLGVSTIHLQTESYNTRARQLYEAFGFVNQQRDTLTYKIDYRKPKTLNE